MRRLAHDWSAETRYVAMLDGAAVRAGLDAVQAAGEDLLGIAVEGETITLEAHYAFPPGALARTLDAARACDSLPIRGATLERRAPEAGRRARAAIYSRRMREWRHRR